MEKRRSLNPLNRDSLGAKLMSVFLSVAMVSTTVPASAIAEFSADAPQPIEQGYADEYVEQLPAEVEQVFSAEQAEPQELATVVETPVEEPTYEDLTAEPEQQATPEPEQQAAADAEPATAENPEPTEPAADLATDPAAETPNASDEQAAQETPATDDATSSETPAAENPADSSDPAVAPEAPAASDDPAAIDPTPAATADPAAATEDPTATDPATEGAADEPTAEDAIETHVVKFYNRDAELIKTVELATGTAIGDQLPETIAREDYIAYWAIGTIEPDGQGNKVTPNSDHRIAGGTAAEALPGDVWAPAETDPAEIVIVPDYKKITYSVTFLNEDQTKALYTKTVNVDTSYCLNDIPAVPAKSGYTGKWVYSNGEGEDATTADFANTVTITKDTAVWPEYTQNVFTATFTVNGKPYHADTYYTGDELALPADPVVEGKQFKGWFAGETQYVGGEQITADLTLEAQFDDEYSVSFVILDDEGKQVVETLSQYFRTDGETIGTMPQNPFVAGKVFEKWVKATKNADGTYTPTDEEVTAATEVNGSFTAVAIFREITVYTITAEYYYKNDRGEDVTFNTDLLQIEASDLPYEIIAPASTQTAESEVKGGPVYYAKTPTVEVTTDTFGDETECTVRIEYVEHTAEYDFVYLLKDLEGDTYTEIADSREHVLGVLHSTVTATVKDFDYATFESAETATITEATGQRLEVKYTRKNYSVSYESNGGSYVGGATVPYGTAYEVTETVPTRNGYKFDGWYLDEGLTKPAGTTVTANGNTTLYAKWTGDTVNYTIVYMFEKFNDAGTVSDYVYDNSRTGSGTVGTTVQASSAPTITRTGWEKDTAKNATSSVEIAADGSSVLFVYYKLTEYTFTFNLGSDTDYRMTIGGTTYYNNNNSTKYSFTAKLGQDVSDKWPVNSGNATIWDSSYSSKYYF